VIKRIFDIAVAGSLLIMAIVPMMLAALGIKFSSPGPLIYRADRMGKDERPFAMYKFRTMAVKRGKTAEITAPNDNRIFRFGNFLRITKIDELPQLWNVLIGDMSIVGPRPEATSIVRHSYTGWMKETLKVRPGITSPGALFGYTHGNKMLSDDDPEGSYIKHLLTPKLAIERAYIQKANWITDLAVIVKTVGIIVAMSFGKNDFPLPKEAAEAGQFYDFPEMTRKRL